MVYCSTTYEQIEAKGIILQNEKNGIETYKSVEELQNVHGRDFVIYRVQDDFETISNSGDIRGEESVRGNNTERNGGTARGFDN